MDPFPKALPPPRKDAQANPTAAQKTQWIAHLHHRLRRNAVHHPFKHWSSSSHCKLSTPSIQTGGEITLLLQEEEEEEENGLIFGTLKKGLRD
jgi:hypothetical protein